MLNVDFVVLFDLLLPSKRLVENIARICVVFSLAMTATATRLYRGLLFS